MATEKTYTEITEFASEAAAYLRQEKKNEKIAVAIGKMLGDPMRGRAGKLTPAQEQYQEDCNNVRIKHCSVDKEGNILKDQNKQLVYSKDTLKKCNEELKKLLDKKYSFDPFIVEVEQGELDEYQLEAFKEFIIE